MDFSRSLIIEASEPKNGLIHTEETRGGFSVISSSLGSDSYATVVTGSPCGITTEKMRALVSLVGEITGGFLRRLSEKPMPRVLAVGLGNPSLSCDSLGARCVEKIISDGETSFTVIPLTKAKTGFSSSDIIRCLAKEARADMIIAVDSLAARYKERLGTVVQFSDSGISPGSGVGSDSGEISRATMPCPVLSVGVPTVIRSDLLGDGGEPMLVTTAGIGETVGAFASAIGGGINIALLRK